MSTIGATDPTQELNITVSSVRRRFNGKWLAFLLPKGMEREGEERERARERERERDVHRQTHTHPIVRAETESRQGREGERGERAPEQPCASELGSARAEPACWSSARLSGDLTCCFSSALLCLRLRTLTMSSHFQQVNCFKSLLFLAWSTLHSDSCTFWWLGTQEEKNPFELQILAEGFCIADLLCYKSGHFVAWSVLLFAL